LLNFEVRRRRSLHFPISENLHSPALTSSATPYATPHSTISNPNLLLTQLVVSMKFRVSTIDLFQINRLPTFISPIFLDTGTPQLSLPLHCFQNVHTRVRI